MREEEKEEKKAGPITWAGEQRKEPSRPRTGKRFCDEMDGTRTRECVTLNIWGGLLYNSPSPRQLGWAGLGRWS